jgi:hypothetical protein
MLVLLQKHNQNTILLIFMQSILDMCSKGNKKLTGN